MGREFVDVDPKTLHVLPSSPGADPLKLHRQIAQFGRSTTGMPPLWVYRGIDGGLVIFNGLTRATRVAKLLPGTFVRVEIIGDLRVTVAHYPTIGDLLP